tara:strand:- start:59 stop:799 length:741 start_codon:yes stop_codon:yes gene_type:complete
MFNYLLKIEYDGSNYVGWQSQKNGKSIQDKIERALKKILKTKVRINGAGRTDKGVHAFGQYANFKVNNEINNKNKFINSINFFLKKEFISILTLKKVKEGFHPRFNAKERIYEYKIINREGPLSIDINKAWHIKNKFEISLLRKAAKMLVGSHDFSTFRAATCSAKSPLRKINQVNIKKKDDQIFITFKSKSFLQTQVRSMVGCLKYVSTGKWSIQQFKKVFKAKKRSGCAPPAPPCGLYLKNIRY